MFTEEPQPGLSVSETRGRFAVLIGHSRISLSLNPGYGPAVLNQEAPILLADKTRR
jgi:hypothetical protein